VTFHPTNTPTRTANLYIGTNDPVNPTVRVALTGNGVLLRAPTINSLQVQPNQTPPRIRVVFRDNANNETGFVIERSQDGGVSYQQVGTRAPSNPVTGTPQLTYDDTTVTFGSGISYTYRMAAARVSTVPAYSIQSPWSNTATATAP
jgi:hypothetical protein